MVYEMKNIEFKVVMITKNGVALLFNDEIGYMSTDPEAIRTSLAEDMKGSDEFAKIARNIWIKAALTGGIKNL